MKKIATLTLLATFFAACSYAQSGDPWIKKVYNDTWGRDPSAMEYNINNYNNGHWNNYSELMKYVYEFRKNMASAGITFKYSEKSYNKNVVVAVYQNGTQIAVDLISNDGGSIVAQGGSGISYNNIVGKDGGNIVAQGAGNIAISAASKGASFGSAYTLASEGTKVVKTSSGGALIIK